MTQDNNKRVRHILYIYGWTSMSGFPSYKTTYKYATCQILTTQIAGTSLKWGIRGKKVTTYTNRQLLDTSLKMCIRLKLWFVILPSLSLKGPTCKNLQHLSKVGYGTWTNSLSHLLLDPLCKKIYHGKWIPNITIIFWPLDLVGPYRSTQYTSPPQLLYLHWLHT